MTRFLLVCLGGAAGSGARYLVTLWAFATFGMNFPYGTLIVNVVGSFVISLVLNSGIASDDLRVMLTAGVLGGFTTYSAFNYETTQLLRGQATLTALTYAALTLFSCLAAGFAGLAVARAISR